MRRKGGSFEIVIKSPTLGLMTRVPGDQPDPRYATAASNVRFDDGVVRNAPGYQSLILNPPLATFANLIFQCNVNPGPGGDKLRAVMVCATDRIYALRGLKETNFGLTENQVIEFRADLHSHNDIRALPTAQRTGRTGEPSGSPELNWVVAVSISDNLEIWKFRARNPNEQDDDAAYLVPNDYGTGTNNNIFVRVA